MKMNYLLKNNLKSKNKNWRLKIISIILLFILLFFIARIGVFKETLNKFALPFWKFDAYAGGEFSSLFSIIRSKKSLILENRRLNGELDKTKSEMLIYEELQKENQDLKALLGRDDVKKGLVLGAVLVKPSISPFDVVIIDIGKDKGVEKGDRVLYQGTIIIGEIDEALANSSKVKMYSSPGEKFIAFIGPKSIQVEAEGLGGGNFMAKLPREMLINKGDMAIVPGIATSVFGFVERVESNPADSFQKVLFKNSVNLAEMKWVEVEVKK